MASGKLLRQLIKTGAEGNYEGFRQVSEEVIRQERSKKHHLLANDLERILYGRANSVKKIPFALNDNLPKDREHGIPLLQIKEPTRRLEDVVLSDENSSLLEEILQELHRSEVLKSYGLYPVDRLLFCGPPGCGKTLTADVERVLRRAAKDMVLSGKEFLSERHVQSAIRREDDRKSRLKRS